MNAHRQSKTSLSVPDLNQKLVRVLNYTACLAMCVAMTICDQRLTMIDVNQLNFSNQLSVP